MKKFDYKKVLVSGNEYECTRILNGRVYLFYVENGIKHAYTFDDTMHDGFLSKTSYFVTPDQMTLEVRTIDFVNYITGYTHFTGRIKFGDVIPTESIEEDKKI